MLKIHRIVKLDYTGYDLRAYPIFLRTCQFVLRGASLGIRAFGCNWPRKSCAKLLGFRIKWWNHADHGNLCQLNTWSKQFGTLCCIFEQGNISLGRDDNYLYWHRVVFIISLSQHRLGSKNFYLHIAISSNVRAWYFPMGSLRPIPTVPELLSKVISADDELFFIDMFASVLVPTFRVEHGFEHLWNCLRWLRN